MILLSTRQSTERRTGISGFYFIPLCNLAAATAPHEPFSSSSHILLRSQIFRAELGSVHIGAEDGAGRCVCTVQQYLCIDCKT